MKTPALICLCFQALAEALKINSSVTNIDLKYNPRHPVTVTSLDGLEVL